MAVYSLQQYAKEEAEKKKKKKKSGSTIEDAISLKDFAYEHGEDIAPVRMTTSGKKEEKKERTWFDSGAFDDGYQFGDVTRTILGSVTDVGEHLTSGVLGMGEKMFDAMTYLAPTMHMTQQAQAGRMLTPEDLKMADKMRADAQELIKKDLYDERKIARNIITNPAKKIGIHADTQSVFGEKSDVLVESAGQLGATIGLQAVGLPWWLTTGATSFGAETENAFNQGATYEQAGASAFISAGAEILTEKLSGGINFGGKTLDDVLLKPLTDKISGKVTKRLVDIGIDAFGEGAEEVISGIFSNLGSSLYREENLSQILASEEAMDEYIESFIGGAVLGGGMSGVNAIVDAKRESKPTLTENEKKVVDKEVENRIAEKEADGTKLSKSEKTAIEKQVYNDLEKGYISIDTIESALGGEAYNQYKKLAEQEESLQKEFDELNKMKQGEMTGEQIDRRTELKQQLQELKKYSTKDILKQKASVEAEKLSVTNRLSESYNEKARRSQKFEADITKYDAKQQAVIKKAQESGILNNTNRTHEFVDMVAKISAEKGVLFDFTNNERLKESGFAVEGKTVNGYVTKEGNISLNIDSTKALNTIVGHEITHVLEGTDLHKELVQAVKQYAITKGEYQTRFDSIAKLYKDVDGAVVENEITADLVGEYLFTDSDFINNLSTKQPNIFKKIYDEIKYLYKIATAGSKEARQLEKVKRAFDKAYKESGKTKSNTKYALSEVEAVQPKSDKWKRTLTTAEAKERFPKLWDVTAEESEVRNPTQISSTVKSYRKVYDYLKAEGFDGTILDASSGLGYGTKAGIEEYGFDVEDIEPYPDKNYKPKYKDYSALDKKYDAIISNAVLNVLPQDQRDALVVRMGELLNDGGRMFINVRGKDVDSLGNNKNNTNISPMEWFVDGTGSYQKGFKKPELVAYLQDALGDGFTVEPTNLFGAVSVIVTKDGGQQFAPTGTEGVRYSLSSDSDGNKLTKEQQEYFKDSVVRDENGNLKVMYHGTSSGGYTVFDPFGVSKYGLFGAGAYFTDNKSVAESYTEKGKGNSKQVYETYLNIKNPIDMDAQGDYDAWSDAFPDADFPKEGTNEQFFRAMEQVFRDEQYPRWEAMDTAMYTLEYMGYDGITHIGGGRFNKSDETRHRVYIAFEPEQIKNTTNTSPTDDVDIRYSLSEDSEGTRLTKEQHEYFKDSKVVDENGNLKVMYHGTEKGGFHEFDSGFTDDNRSFFFTDNNETAKSYSGTHETYNPKALRTAEEMNNFFAEIDADEYEVREENEQFILYEDGDEVATSDTADGIYEEFRDWTGLGYGSANYQAYLNITNPLTIDADSNNWDEIVVPEELREALGETASTRDFSKYAQENGYDGVIFNNIIDNGVFASNMKRFKTSTVAIAFDSNQIKSVANEKPTSDADIRYSLSEMDMEYDEKSETVSYSLSSLEDAFDYNKGEEAYKKSREDYTMALMKSIGDTSAEGRAKAERYLDSMFLVHDMIARDKDRLDYKSAPNKTAWVGNSEYGGSIDFSTLCAKRRLFTGTFDAIQNALPDTVLTDADYLQIRNLLLEHGQEAPCSMCYVEGSRAKHGTYVKKWLNEYLKTDPEWKPQIADFTSTTRLEQTRIQHPEAYAEYVKAMNKLSQRKPKEASVRTDYKGEILQSFKNGESVEQKNINGGIRFNSFSDFEIIHTIDAMQVITDMARVGLNGQAYTKVKEFAECFGNTGMKINLSLVAKDVDADGNLVYDEVNGMNYNEAIDIRNRYSDNVGTVIVVFNEAQMKSALADPSIDFVLPFHRSQWRKTQYAMMGLPTQTKDFTNVQNDRYKNPKTGRAKKVPTGNIMPNQYWDFTKSGRENAQIYLDYINANNYIPKFDSVLKKVDGKWVLPDGPVGDGYFKLLIDFKMYNNDGVGIPQSPVVPEFNMPYIQQMLEDYKGGHHAFPVANDVVEDFLKTKNTRYSLSEQNIAPVGNYHVYGKDIALEMPQDTVQDVAPVISDAEMQNVLSPSMTEAEANERDAYYGDRPYDDVPEEMEAPYYGEPESITPDNPFDERDIQEVGNRKTKAYMYENPEVKPYFQEEAEYMLGELQNSIKGERTFNDHLYYETAGEQGWFATKRETSEALAYLRDNFRYTTAQLEKGLKAIIEDNGKENNAISKRIEFMLDERLREGYTDFMTGEHIPANQDYINLLVDKQIHEYSDEAYNEWLQTLAEEEPVEVDMEDFAPIKEPEQKMSVSEEDTEAEEEVEEKEEIARILDTEPKTESDRNKRKWAIFKANVLDKGAVFEDIALKSKNRELMGKWNYTLYSESRAQRLIGSGNAENGVKSLNDIRAEVENSGLAKQFYEYIYHKHNVDRMKLAERYEDVPNKPVFGYEVTAEVSQEIVDQYEFAEPRFMDFAQDIYNYMTYLRQQLLDNSVISQETADLWSEMYPHYVPIRRVGDTGLNINVPLDTGRTGVNAPIKRATGGSSDILPLFDTMAMRTMQTYKATAKNSFGVELKNTIGSNKVSAKTSVDELIDSIDMQEKLLQEGTNGRKPTFTVFENGERVTFEITEDMYDALKPVSSSSMLSKTIEPLNVASNIHRGVLTEYNPVFLLTNAIKDTQDVLMNSQHSARTYLKIPEAHKQILTKGYWFDEYMENGGDQNTYFDNQTNTFKTENKGIKKLLDMPPFSTISTLNNYIEMIPRLAEYIASREAGKSIEVSMLDSARVTTNFRAGGDFTKFLNRNGATFLNASVQGAMQQVRNVREAKANGMKGWMNLATKFAIAGLPAFVLNNLVWDDDEEYEELSDYVKQNYYVVGKYDDGKFIRIPKGRTVAVIQEAIRQISNAVTGNDEADLNSFLELAISNLAPNNPLESNILAPIVQAYKNETWYGEDLVPTRLQDLPASEQFDESTDKFSKWLGEKLDISPVKINYVLDQYSGGVGDVVLPMLTPEAESGADSLGEYFTAPLRSKFTTDSILNNQNISDFYDTSDKLTMNAKKSNATAEDVLMNKYINSVKSEMNELYKEKREIQNSNLSNKIKYERVREIQRQLDELSKKALGTYENVTIDGDYARIGDRHYRLNDEGEWTKVNDKQLEKQEEVTNNLNVSEGDYWSEKEEYDFAYESPGKYSIAKAVGGYDSYKSYSKELSEFRADKDENGKTISGSAKAKKKEYIFNLDLDYGQQVILYRSLYDSKADKNEYNEDIVDYLNSRDDISWEDMRTILLELDFEVEDDGTIRW